MILGDKMKKFVFMVSMIVCILGFSSFVYAGKWEQDITNREWRYRLDDGSLVMNNWLKTKDGSWYHLDKQGYMQRGWVLDAGKWYYLDGVNGFMWHNTWYGEYYLGSDGAMFVNTITPDGYKVGSDGKRMASNHELSKEQKGMLVFIADSIYKEGEIANYSQKDLIDFIESLVHGDANHRYNTSYPELLEPIFSIPVKLSSYSYGYQPNEVLDRFYDITGRRVFAGEYFTEQNKYEYRSSSQYFTGSLASGEGISLYKVSFESNGENLMIHCFYEQEYDEYAPDIHHIVTFRKNPNSYYGYTVVSMEEK